jgi:EmrB/QacA subfamily drug resistance transporter
MTNHEPGGPNSARPSRATMLIYGAVLVVYFMAILDFAIVSTVVPTITGEFGDVSLFGWVGAGYLLALAATSPFYAKLGDMFGRRTIMLTAVGLFVVGSLACGLASSMGSLVGARVLQGLGAGGLTVSAYATIGELFGARDRPTYQGYVAIVFTLALVSGPVVGGFITDFLGWRWVFLINLPLGLLSLTVLVLAMPRRFAGKAHRIDFAGGLLLAFGTVSIILWSDYVLDPGASLWLRVGLPVLGLAALAAFVVVERRAEEPIIPLRLLANSTIALSIAATIVGGVVTLGLMFHSAFYVQVIANLSASQLGLLLLALPLGSMATATISGRIISRNGRYKWFLVAAMVLGAATMVGFALTGAATPIWLFVVVYICLGMSLGLWQQVVVVAAQNAAPAGDIGVATGLITQSRAIGGSLGLALNGAVAAWALAGQEAELPAEVSAALPGGLPNVTPAAMTVLPETLRTTVLDSFAAGFHTMFLFAAVVFCLALVLVSLLRDVRIEKRG